MPSINFKSLQKPKTSSTSKYIYVDLHLDLQEDNVPNTIAGNNVVRGRDLRVSPDIKAINNSLTNLFSTSIGERVLNPQYGCDLHRYIFEPLTEDTASEIGRSIKSAITQWEQRVELNGPIKVFMREDQHEYRVEISLFVPSLKLPVSYSGVLSKSGFAEIIPGPGGNNTLPPINNSFRKVNN